MGTGLYNVAKLAPNPDGSGWDTRITDDVLTRDEAIDWINRNRPRSPRGTLYRLVELTHEELEELTGDDDA